MIPSISYSRAVIANGIIKQSLWLTSLSHRSVVSNTLVTLLWRVRVQFTWFNFALAFLDNRSARILGTGFPEVHIFFEAHRTECIPPIGIPPLLCINAWTVNKSRTCFPTVMVFSFYLFCVPWIGANSVPVDESYPFATMTDQIPYADFQSE